MAPKRLPPKKVVKSKGLPWGYMGCGAVLIVLTVLFYRASSIGKGNSSATTAAMDSVPEFPQVPGFEVVGEIAAVQFPRVPTAKLQGTLQQVIKDRTPLVLLNSPWTRWPANEKWKNTSYLTEQVPLLKHVYRHTSRHFVYEDRERPLINLQGVVGPPLKETLDMATSEFFEHMYNNNSNNNNTNNNNEQPKKWHYFADVIGEDSNGYRGFEAASADIPNWEAFIVRDRHPLLPQHLGHSYEGSAHIWMHQQGAVTQTHYDPTHNFYYLIQGRKRFTISSPNNHDLLYLHPFSHPCHRQTQTYVLAESQQNESALFPKYGKAEAVTVVLEEGHMLYLPPFTPHQVEALSPSISVNVWSPSVESDLDIIINSIPLPPLLQKPTNDPAEQAMRVRGLARYIRSVIAKSLNISANLTLQFLDEKIIQPKFSPLFDKLHCGSESFNSSRCPVYKVNTANSAGLTGDKIGNMFRSTRKALFEWHWSALELVLSDYVERVVTFVVGVENTCSFLRCLALPSSWGQIEPE